MKITYKARNFRSEASRIITQADDILTRYDADGFVLSLRQLYYQFVAKNIIPNTERSYKRLGSIVNDARLAGLLDWDMMKDRTREHHENPHWPSISSILHSAAQSFAVDKWETQPYRAEVWVEKDALLDVVAQACEPEDVSYFSCRGYTSQSAMWEAAQRIETHLQNGFRVQVFHLGDHDPSGIDMSRDIESRLRMFLGGERDCFCEDCMTCRDYPGEAEANQVGFNFTRIALSKQQIKDNNLPPNPTKITDSRASSYVRKHGNKSWELDALDPHQIVNLIQGEIADIRRLPEWEKQVERELDGQVALRNIASEIEI
jgi:hypothetical protein